MSMQAAQVTQWGEPPQHTTIPIPPRKPGQTRVKVLAVGIHNIVRARAAGTHYSVKELPHHPGVDGIGMTEDGQRVFFMSFDAAGTLREYVNAFKVYPLPEELDTIQAAAMINSAISSWLAIRIRAPSLPKNFAILIIGSTSASGRCAVHLAKVLGAGKVLTASRTEGDINLLRPDFSGIEVDLILDYVYGEATEQLFKTMKTPRPVLYIQIGELSKQEITLPGSGLRGKDITIRGSGIGAWGLEEADEHVDGLLKALVGIRPLPVQTAPLKDIETEWNVERKERLVFVL